MMLDALSLDQLRVFVAIADHGSFSAAARHLGRAQSAMSNAISNLETALGLTLFERDGWKPRMTPHGEALLVDARAVIERSNQLKMKAQGLTQGLEAEVSLIVDVMYPAAAFVSLVTRFQQTFPRVELRLRTEILGGVPDMVVSGQYLLGIQGSFPDVPPELTGRLLAEVAIGPVARPDHPLSAGRGIPREALNDHTQIVLADHSNRTLGRTFSVYSEHRIYAADLAYKHVMLRSGLGWGFMPLSYIEGDVRSGDLVELDFAERPPRSRRMPLSLIYRQDALLGPAAQWIVDNLLNATALDCAHRTSISGRETA
jgi:DNA-binding transcriptional LysR family regulator